MPSKQIFQQIVDTIRHDIYTGKLQSGDALPAVRTLAKQYGCAPGTVSRAYRQLTDDGLITSRVGQGTRVADVKPMRQDDRLQQLNLVNRVEGFVLDLLGVGHTTAAIESAMRQALDNIAGQQGLLNRDHPLRFVGSHDPALSMTSSRIASNYLIDLNFTGSMNGLLELSRGNADFSGCHLYDSETHSYNTPFVARLFSGREVGLVTLASRRLGLIVAKDNPLAIYSLYDLLRHDVRFVNRQAGAGTRLWFDNQLVSLGIPVKHIGGYEQVANTHSVVAKQVAEGAVDVGVGVEAAAQMYGLGFVPLTMEQYDLVIPIECWNLPAMQALVGSLYLDETRRAIDALGGYDTSKTGTLNWLHATA
jgi:molybdate-binding protein/DNA-binding transcriptional regulator YhcF (GntR family)